MSTEGEKVVAGLDKPLATLDLIAQALGLAREAGGGCLILGAGASVSAGIPTAAGMVALVRERFPETYRLATRDGAVPSYRRLLGWLSEGERARLIGDVLGQARLNWEHLIIAELMACGFIGPALTVNFDRLLISACARANVQPAGYDLREAQRQAMLQAALSYQDIALTRASMAIAAQLVQDAQRFYDIANARAVAEVASGADVARAEAALAQARRVEIQARAFWKTASIRLAQLLRWDLRELLTTKDAEVGLRPVIDDASEATLTGEAGRARPDVQAANKRAEGGTLRAKQRWWDLLGPEIDASIGGRFVGRDMSSLATTFIGYAFVGLSFDFEKGGRIRTAKANAKALQFRAEATSEQAGADIETAIVNVQAAREAIPPARAEVDAAERSYAIELARFDAGTGSGLEVIQSQNMQARAKLTFIEQILRFNAAQIELAAAIGHLSPELFAP